MYFHFVNCSHLFIIVYIKQSVSIKTRLVSTTKLDSYTELSNAHNAAGLTAQHKQVAGLSKIWFPYSVKAPRLGQLSHHTFHTITLTHNLTNHISSSLNIIFIFYWSRFIIASCTHYILFVRLQFN